MQEENKIGNKRLYRNSRKKKYGIEQKYVKMAERYAMAYAVCSK